MWNMSRKRYSFRKISLQRMNAMKTGEMMVQSHYQSNPTDGVTLIISGKLLYCRENCRRITKTDFIRDISLDRRNKSLLHLFFFKITNRNGFLMRSLQLRVQRLYLTSRVLFSIQWRQWWNIEWGYFDSKMIVRYLVDRLIPGHLNWWVMPRRS